MSGSDASFMAAALALAEHAAREGEVPVGAVLTLDGKIIGEGWNQPIQRHDPTAHAEIVALKSGAARLGNYRLEGCTLYVTLEPCAMCMGALINARVARLVFGALDPKAGACGSILDLSRTAALTHRLDVFGGVLNEESAALLRSFFAARR